MNKYKKTKRENSTKGKHKYNNDYNKYKKVEEVEWGLLGVLLVVHAQAVLALLVQAVAFTHETTVCLE